MSTRARIASAAAGVGVLALGWQVGTADGRVITTATQESKVTAAADTRAADTRAADSQAASTTSYQDGTWTGQSVGFRYGQVTVSVTIEDGQITALSEELVSDGDHHSVMINEMAVPTVKEEIVAANSAEVSTISGATYTTQAYLQSLQAALDEASA